MIEVQKILGEQVYRSLYKSNGGALRHRLFHGAPVTDQDLGDLSTKAYNAIIKLSAQHLRPQ